MPVALIAAMRNVNIEDLTVVTLAHELAHGYTHLGRDIDGRTWSNRGSGETDLRVGEGLAQFYTDVVTMKLLGRSPRAHRAYEKLLELQSGPYRVHENWLKESKGQRGETVRFTMLAARNKGSVKYDEWESMLLNTSGTLKRNVKAASEHNLFLDGTG